MIEQLRLVEIPKYTKFSNNEIDNNIPAGTLPEVLKFIYRNGQSTTTPYTLPQATSTILGGIKLGKYLSFNSSTNQVDVDLSSTGTVKKVNGIFPDTNGAITIAVGTVTSVNSINPDNTGNVSVGTVKSVNGNTPDANGNVNVSSTGNGTIDETNIVHKTGDETISNGIKTFTVSPLVPIPTEDNQVANKKYVDDKVAAIPPSGSTSTNVNKIPSYSVTSDGAQSITLPTGATSIDSVYVLETSGYTRIVYPDYYSISNGVLNITSDANIKNGYKITGYYFTQSNNSNGNMPVAGALVYLKEINYQPGVAAASVQRGVWQYFNFNNVINNIKPSSYNEIRDANNLGAFIAPVTGLYQCNLFQGYVSGVLTDNDYFKLAIMYANQPAGENAQIEGGNQWYKANTGHPEGRLVCDFFLNAGDTVNAAHKTDGNGTIDCVTAISFRLVSAI